MNDVRVDDIRQLLAEDDLESAIPQILQLARGTGDRFHDEAVLLSGRVRGWERRKRTGSEPPETVKADRVGLIASAMALLAELGRSRTAVPGSASRVEVGQVDIQLERLYGLAPLRDIAWLRRGLTMARAVCRIIAPSWKGTGFLATGGWLITNHHVLPTEEIARASECEFNYEEDLDGRMLDAKRYRLDPATHRADENLDLARIKIVDREDAPLSSWGELSFERSTPPKAGDHVAIIQHPDGGPKKIALGGNQIVNLFDHRLQYMTDTMPGSSGAPVFNDRWCVVAVHHAGGNLARSSKGDRIYANEGILIEKLLPLL